MLTATTWPIAAAMLPFGSITHTGEPIHDAPAELWADHLKQVSDVGFTEVDPTDTWVRVGDLSPTRLDEFKGALGDAGLTIPAISTSRRSVIDATRGEDYLAYGHRLIDVAPSLGASVVSFGFFQELTPAQQKALWFWLAPSYKDPDDPEIWQLAVSRIRELGEHAKQVGIQISLEMYEDTYVGTCDDAIRFVEEVNCDAVGLNPDIGNFIRLHRPIEPVQQMFDKVLPHANFWHVKNYSRDEDPTTGTITTYPMEMAQGLINYRRVIRQALALGFSGPFLCEHYGSDGLGVCGRNREYIQGVLRSALA